MTAIPTPSIPYDDDALPSIPEAERLKMSWLSPAAGIIVSVSILVALGIVMVFSSSATVCADRYYDPLFFMWKQSLFVGIGLIACLIIRRIDYRIYARYRYLILSSALILLALVLIPGLGRKVNGSRRWFHLGVFNVQPSEFVKLCMVIYMANLLSRKQDVIHQFWKGFLPPVVVMGGAFLLIAMEPDLGTALLISATLFMMLFVAGIRWKHLMLVLGAMTPAVVYLILFKATYIIQRIHAFLNADLADTGINYQQNISLMALARGGLTGQGVGNGMFKHHFLPEAHNDFILAIVGEELGLIGTIAVVMLFVLFLVSALRIFKRARDMNGAMIAFGLAFSIVAQAIINMAVVTKSMPNKGIALPFVSYGGSSVVFSLMAVGILLNIAGQLRRDAPEETLGAVRVSSDTSQATGLS